MFIRVTSKEATPQSFLINTRWISLVRPHENGGTHITMDGYSGVIVAEGYVEIEAKIEDATDAVIV